MRFLCLALLFLGVAYAQTPVSVNPPLRVAVLLPDAPLYGDPQLQSIVSRFQEEMDKASGAQKLEFVNLDNKVCRQLECALELGRANKLDLVVLSRLQAKGGNHDFEANAVGILGGVSVATVRVRFGATLGELEQLRPKLARELVAGIEKSMQTRGLGDYRSAVLHSGTPIPSSVLSGALSLEGSPYLVYGNISVPSGKELWIEPGVVIYFVPGQSGGISVFGQIVAEGTPAKPIRFLSAAKEPQPWDWNRILISGDGRSSLRHVEVAHSNYGIHVENSGLTVQHARLHDNSLRGIYVRNGQVDLQDAEISGGHIVGLQVSALGQVQVIRSRFLDNRNAIAVMPQGNLELGSSTVQGNDRGIIVLEGGSLVTEKNRVERNQVGIGTEIPWTPDMFDGVRENGTNMIQMSRATIESALVEPVTQEVDRVMWQGQTSGVVGERREPEVWNTYGNLQLGAGYTKVITARNQGPLAAELETDTLAPGRKYPNRFTVDGLWSTGNAYVILESSKGRGLEIQVEGKADRWVTARAKPVTVRYWSPLHSLTIGHLNESASPLLLSGFEVLGIKYLLNFGSNSGDQPLFTTDAFVGESRQSFASGDRNPDLFEDRFPEGGAVSQQLSVFGRVSFAPTPQMRFQAGAISSEDRSSDILIRDTFSKSQELRDPLADAKAAFVSGEWATRRGGFQVHADVAIGRADTTDVFYQAALDEVFAQAGLSPVPLSQVRKMFLSDVNIREADSSEVFQILERDLNLEDARDSLVVLRHMVMEAQDSLESEGLGDRTASLSWRKQNLAARLQFDWNYSGGNVQVTLQSIGSNYFSPGASGLLQNSREYGVDWNQTLLPFWDIHAQYLLSVENASGVESGSSNLLGLGEGSSLGFRKDDAYQREHLMDADRTRYVHQIGMDHRFRLARSIDLAVGYQFEHSRQYLPTRLKADITPDAGVVLDSWFEERTGEPSVMVDRGYGDSVQVDSARWDSYQSLANEDSIAWGFHDLRSKHALSASIQWSRKAFSIKAGGEWTIQLDQSEFTKDDLVSNFDFADSTWQKLGYHPESQSWLEHAYPISLTSSVGRFTNKATFKPRWRYYEKADQQEFEYSFNDRIERAFFHRKLICGITGEVNRQIRKSTVAEYWMERKSDSAQYSYYRIGEAGEVVPVSSARVGDIEVQGGEDIGEDYRIVRHMGTETIRQWDLLLEMTLRVNWTNHLYTELLGRIDDYRRPDQLEEQHRDFTGALNAFYSF